MAGTEVDELVPHLSQDCNTVRDIGHQRGYSYGAGLFRPEVNAASFFAKMRLLANFLARIQKAGGQEV